MIDSRVERRRLFVRSRREALEEDDPLRKLVGGTRLPTAQECLAILDCAGTGKAAIFAEVCAATWGVA